MADCGLRRIAALTGFGRIADCTLGTLRCKDASTWMHERATHSDLRACDNAPDCAHVRLRGHAIVCPIARPCARVLVRDCS
eukprot:5585063-Alexandrium_andersonii.AAC.1